jgi:hypothetical protein
VADMAQAFNSRFINWYLRKKTCYINRSFLFILCQALFNV